MVVPADLDTFASGSIGELLNQTPSVSLRRTSGISYDPRIRGFTSSQMNGNANGMTELKARIDIDSLFGPIDPGIVQSISVIDGPYTSLFGPGFAFISADLFPAPRFAEGPQFHGSTIFTYANNGRQIYTRENLSGGGPDWGFYASYGLRTGNDYSPGGSFYDFRVPASYNEQDVFFAGGVDLTRYSRLEFNYIHHSLNDTELPGVAYDIHLSNTEQFNTRWVYQEDPKGPENVVVQFWSQHTMFNGNSNHISKHVTFSDVLLGQPYSELLGGSLLNQGMLDTKGLRALFTAGDKDSLLWTFGVDWRHYTQSYQERDFLPTAEIDFGGDVFGIPRSSIDDFGIFTHASAVLNKDTTVTAGGRFDHTNTFLDLADIVDTTTQSTGSFRPGINEPNQSLGMGYFTLEHRPSEWLRFNGGVGFAMRNPNLTELYSDEPFVPMVRFGNSYTDGNSFLTPEKNLQFDLGVTGKWKQGTITARAFESTIYDYILPVPSNFSTFPPKSVNAPSNLGRNTTAFIAPPLDPTLNYQADSSSLDYQYTNINRATLWGGELYGEVRPYPWLSFSGALSYVQGTNHSPVRFDDNTKTFIPINKGAEALPGIYPLYGILGVRIFEPRHNKWSLEFLSRMVNGQHYVADSLAELPTPGFTVFSVHGSYQLSEHIRLHSSIENLFNRNYYEAGSLAIVNPQGTVDFVKEPGFTWIIGIEAHF
jgi:iron complex outermembrane recepter protein